MLLFSGGYYNIELAGRRLRLISLNMNIYLEDIADEFSYHERSSQGLLRSRHQQKTAEQRRRYNADNRVSAVKINNFWKDEVRASRQLIKNEKVAPSMSNPPSSWVSDPEEQWSWLYRIMEEARKKNQNVSKQILLGLYFIKFCR